MNKLKLIAFATLCAALVSVTSCNKREYDKPPMREMKIDSVFTIGQIIGMGATSFNFAEGVTGGVYGIVTADEVSGNLYKSAYMQDRATGKAINLYMSSSSGLRIGDSICVILNGVTASTYKNLPQLGSSDNPLDPDENIVILDNQKFINPKVVTIAEINASQHTAELIKLENVYFVQPGLNYAEDGGYGERTIKDDAGNTVIVRTSNYANFAKQKTPTGKGSIVAINSVYNTTQQLYIRSISEVVFDGSGDGGGGGSTANPGELQSLPYSQSFEADFGTYTTKDVSGSQSWVIDYSTAKMTGYENSTNYANEDWLISSPVDLGNVTNAKVTVSYICRYFANLNSDMTIQVSTDYTYGNEPSTATWAPITFNWTAGSNWNDFAETEGDLSAYAGQTITLAIKYLSTDEKAGTAEIKSITISEGSATGGGGGTSGDAAGTGTQDDPYNVAAAIQNQNNSTAWVTGYIVGAVKNGTSSISSNEDVIWSAAVDSKTNVVIADSQTETNINNCVIVNLPTGAIRDAVNLQDNAGNYGKQLWVEGVLRTYFGKAGLRDLTGNYTLEGQGGDDNYTYYLNQNLLTQASFDSFSTFNVDGDQEWTVSTSYGAVMTGYDDATATSYANEDWLITPVINLTTATNPVLTFDHARGPAASINIGVSEGYYTVWITNSYTDNEDPTDDPSAWTELTGITHGTSAWGYVSSGEIAIPDAFKTATCRIAFRYLSADGASATWEIKNVKVKE